MKRPDKMIIYNLFPLIAGKFSTWESHYKRVADLGFNWIFINPVQKSGSSGSIYSVADHCAFDPRFLDDNNISPEKQFRTTIAAAKAYGLRTMIDLVASHCSVDSRLIGYYPDWFMWLDGSIAHPFCMEDDQQVIWYDLAKFNNDNEGLYNYIYDLVITFIKLGIEGFRCDAAYQIHPGFWYRLISDVKKIYPDVVFVAETLGCKPFEAVQTAKAGFDYIFNSSKWWNFRDKWFMEQYNLTKDIVPSIGFPESHDTLRLMSEVNGNINAVKQRYLFAALVSAGVMIPFGFEWGFRKKLNVVTTTPADCEWTGIDLSQFIKDVNKIKNSYSIFQEETNNNILYTGDHSVLILKKSSNFSSEEALLLLNISYRDRNPLYFDNIKTFFRQGANIIDLSPEYPLVNVPTTLRYDLNPGQGLVLFSS
jgi:starch synthase (maltosyl-transferring)